MKVTDFLNFEMQLAPTLIKIAYWIGLAVIALATLGGILGASILGSYFSTEMDSFGTAGHGFSILGALIALIGGAISALSWRVLCELVIVVFSINERLGKLVALKKSELETKP